MKEQEEADNNDGVTTEQVSRKALSKLSSSQAASSITGNRAASNARSDNQVCYNNMLDYILFAVL